MHMGLFTLQSLELKLLLTERASKFINILLNVNIYFNLETYNYHPSQFRVAAQIISNYLQLNN